MEIIMLRDICIEYDFAVKEGFYLCPLERLEKIYNGCGPDWLPEFIREKLTSYLSFFEAPFLAHDFEFECSDRTKAGFHLANKRLYTNCKKLVASQYSWWSEPVSKARRYLQAKTIYRACEDFGWSAWMD
ncbi:MAG: hypothetical protein PHV59_00335 [Victivallales bacterium]|nr:hypothetical protein [Victivallales bacterium]